MAAAFDSLYGPMVDVLDKAFGVTFQFWDTGGGCTALVGEFEGGVRVMLTDSPNSENGQEAHISDMCRRSCYGEKTIGYAVGVTVEDALAYGEYSRATVSDLPAIVVDMLHTVAQRNTRKTRTTASSPHQERNTP